MKKRIAFALVLLLMVSVALTGCGDKGKQVAGLVTELQTGDGGELTSFVVRTDNGKSLGVLLTEKTMAVPTGHGPWSGEEMRLEFQEELRPDLQISAYCLSKKETLTTAEGQEIDAYTADHIYITGWLNRGAVTLRDGTSIDVLEDDDVYHRTYRLGDGTNLLWVRGPSGPEGHYAGSLENLDDLDERAKEKVLAFYEERGALYDEAAELERAYAAWRRDGEEFQTFWLEQDTSPGASSERVMYFLTTATIPLDHDDCSGYELRLSDAFDRETGEHIDIWDLFTVSKEEVVRTILDNNRYLEPDLRAEMEAALTPERITVFSDDISVCFEPGSLPSQEHGYFLSTEMDDFSQLMRPWAVPTKQN